jgi:hypothetical protein
MKLRFLILGLFLPLIAHSQERGVGIRLGEPLSITYKDFVRDFISIEAMIGKAGANSSSYYQKNFDNNPPAQNAFYLGDRTQRGISLNLRAALHEDFTDEIGLETGYLLGYAGLGAQIRAVNVTYLYSINAFMPGGPNLTETRTNVDLGPEIFAGGEYYFDELPISVFVEAGFFLEILDRVGHIKGQGGIGIRYLF